MHELVIPYQGPYPPLQMTPGSAGYDIRTTDKITLWPGKSYPFKTGLHLAIPAGYVGIIHPRSGLSFKNNIENGAGVIDSDYRGEIRINLYNFGYTPLAISPGDRIAQLLIQKYESSVFVSVDSLDETERGEQGFGHSGI